MKNMNMKEMTQVGFAAVAVGAILFLTYQGTLVLGNFALAAVVGIVVFATLQFVQKKQEAVEFDETDDVVEEMVVEDLDEERFADSPQ